MKRLDHFVSGQLLLELRLLAACCEHPPSERQNELIENLASEVSDWKHVGAMARRHQVQGFVQDRLSGCDFVPQNIRKRWAMEARDRATLNLRQARATGELHRLANENGIRNLVIKGLPLAAKVYGSLTIKRSSDIDILIDPQQAGRAVELLAREGFVTEASNVPMTRRQTRSVVRHYKEVTLHDDDGIVIDLHWRLIGNRQLLKGIEPFAGARKVTIENIGEIAVLADEDEVAYLCAHGALSDWSRLKWLADVNAVLADRDEAEIEHLYAHAAQLGAGPSMLQALKLRALFWDKPVPASLVRKLEAIKTPEFIAFPIKRMTSPYRPASSRDALRRITMQRRVRSILYGSGVAATRELTSHVRALPDVLAVPLPRWLDWLYVPLRPLMWIARKLR